MDIQQCINCESVGEVNEMYSVSFCSKDCAEKYGKFVDEVYAEMMSEEDDE